MYDVEFLITTWRLPVEILRVLRGDRAQAQTVTDVDLECTVDSTILSRQGNSDRRGGERDD